MEQCKYEECKAKDEIGRCIEAIKKLNNAKDGYDSKFDLFNRRVLICQ